MLLILIQLNLMLKYFIGFFKTFYLWSVIYL